MLCNNWTNKNLEELHISTDYARLVFTYDKIIYSMAGDYYEIDHCFNDTNNLYKHGWRLTKTTDTIHLNNINLPNHKFFHMFSTNRQHDKKLSYSGVKYYDQTGLKYKITKRGYLIDKNSLTTNNFIILSRSKDNKKYKNKYIFNQNMIILRCNNHKYQIDLKYQYNKVETFNLVEYRITNKQYAHKIEGNYNNSSLIKNNFLSFPSVEYHANHRITKPSIFNSLFDNLNASLLVNFIQVKIAFLITDANNIILENKDQQYQNIKLIDKNIKLPYNTSVLGF